MKGLTKINAFRVASTLREKEIQANEFVSNHRITPRGGTPTGAGAISPKSTTPEARAARVPQTKRMPAALTPKPCPSTNFIMLNKKITEYIVDGERCYQDRRYRAMQRYYGADEAEEMRMRQNSQGFQVGWQMEAPQG